MNTEPCIFIDIFFTHAQQPPQADRDADGETSNQNEVPTVTVAMPFLQVDILSHSGASGAIATTTNRMVIYYH